ncbi:Hypothetical protein Tcol_1487 [Trichococcus collinsii]|nr:Hypothetical protein Tcol_1487 [Trichococcus collinsii]
MSNYDFIKKIGKTGRWHSIATLLLSSPKN